MRTTLTLDDDIGLALRERARLLTLPCGTLDLPFKQVVNETLRRGLSPEPNEARLPEFRLVPHQSALAPGIDPLRLNQINDQLESDAFGRPGAA